MMKLIKDNLLLWIILFLCIVAPSFMFGAVQLVGIIILAFVVLLIIGGIVIRWKLYNLAKRAGGNQRQSYYTSASANQEEEEGDVKIYTTKSATEKRVTSDVGDYVDFEEVDKKEE